MISSAVQEHDLTVVSVLSGNRNFEGRIHPEVKANYLASPPLVVAYALAGTHGHRPGHEPHRARITTRIPCYLKDIWPTLAEIDAAIKESLTPEMFRSRLRERLQRRRDLEEGEDPGGQALSLGPERPPTSASRTFFEGLSRRRPRDPGDTRRARAGILGDSVTTDHISPAGSSPRRARPGRWLMEHGVKVEDFNTYGSRRGNHEVMIRGTFANIRIRNKLVPGVEGGYTRHLPSAKSCPSTTPLKSTGRTGCRSSSLRARNTARELARLGGKGRPAAGRARGDRGKLRAHPQVEPRRHGRAPAAVPDGRKRGRASASRARRYTRSRRRRSPARS